MNDKKLKKKVLFLWSQRFSTALEKFLACPKFFVFVKNKN